MLVVVLMMINPIFLMLKSAILKLCQWIQFEFLHCFKRRLLRSFCALPARAERPHGGLRIKAAHFEAFCLAYLLVKTTPFWSKFNDRLPFLKLFHSSIYFESLFKKSKIKLLRSFCALPARAERLHGGLRPKTAHFEAFCLTYLLVKTTPFWSNFLTFF
jgi:hypothetical protein